MLRITGIKAFVVNARMRNWVFVRVETNQPGLVGWGESTLEWHTKGVVGSIEDLTPLLVGEDPRRTQYLWEVMYRVPFFREGTVGMSAISGIDQALHDIRAKDLGVPLFELLGGAVRDRVRFYDHLGGGEKTAVYDPKHLDRFADLALRSVADGFSAIKIIGCPPTGALDSQASVRETVRRIELVRTAVGADVDIMLDFHGRASAAMAIRYAHAVAPFNPWFIEEPVAPDNIGAMEEVARAVNVPIAGGERLVTRFQFRELLERRAVAVVQPDVCHAGGVTEVLRIAAMAGAYGIAVAPHNPLGPIATMVNLHLGLAMPNFLIQEVMRSDVPWRDEVVTSPLALSGGCAEAPSVAGIGTEVNELQAARHPWEPEEILRAFLSDGAIADW